jgi:hypothetical protein
MMRKGRRVAATVLALTLSGAAAAGSFLFYPGAMRYTPPDTGANRQFTNSLRPGTSIVAWLTNDSFEQVVGFYRAVAKEYIPPMTPATEKLPNGERIRKTFLIFDGAPDLVTSRQWISIQHPFIGAVTLRQGKRQYEDVREVTEIVLTEKHTVPKNKDEKPKPAGAAGAGSRKAG